MNRDEEIDIENLKYEVEKLKEENQELQVELDTLKKQLTLTDVGCSKRFEKQDLLKAYQAGAIEQKSINLDTFDFKKLKELQHDSSEWYERYTE
jgi:regulator of replication initiation timing